MKKRSYDFIGFAGAFIVLAAVVALWAGSQARGGTESASSEVPVAPPAGVTRGNSQSAPTQPNVSSQVAASQPQEMGKTNLQSSSDTSPMGSAPVGAANAPVGATTIAWQDSYETAVQRARAEGKPLLVDFYTDWCGYCKKLDAEVYSKPDIIATTGNFVCVKVNAEQRRDLAGAYNVTGFPTVAFVRVGDKGNTMLGALPGYVDAPQFAQVLSQAQSQYQQAGNKSA